MADDESTDVAAAHRALRSGQWAQARDGYLAALRAGADPAAFVGLAQAGW